MCSRVTENGRDGVPSPSAIRRESDEKEPPGVRVNAGRYANCVNMMFWRVRHFFFRRATSAARKGMSPAFVSVKKEWAKMNAGIILVLREENK